MEIQQLIKKIDDLFKKVQQLEIRRVYQQMIIPDAIKMRHMGEGNRFVRSGLETNLPSSPELGTDSSAFYFATDTNKLYIHNGTAWVSTTLS